MAEDYPATLVEFEARFPTEEACWDYLARLRWPEGFRCPRSQASRRWPRTRGLVGYRHKVTNISRSGKLGHEVLPRVHRIASLLKRWLLGTHQGAVRPLHLDYYLDEFTFRFNRRTSRSRGKLFYRLVQQAVEVPPVFWRDIANAGRGHDHNT